MNQWQSQSRRSLFIFRLPLSLPLVLFPFTRNLPSLPPRRPPSPLLPSFLFFSHFTSSHFHFSSFHHLLPSLLHLVHLSSRSLVLSSFSSVSYFCPLRVHVLLRFILRIFTDIYRGGRGREEKKGAPRIQLFPFLFPTHRHWHRPTSSNVVKTFFFLSFHSARSLPPPRLPSWFRPASLCNSALSLPSWIIN